MRLSTEAKMRRDRFTLFLALSLLAHVLFIFGLPRILPTPVKEPEALMVELEPTPKRIDQLAAEEAKQIVNTEKLNNNKVPENVKLMGERNQTADKETRARVVERFTEGGDSTKGTKSAPPAAQPSLSLKSLAPQHEVSAKPDPEGDQVADQKKPAPQAPESGGGKVSANNDYLKDVREGDKTVLSTKEFVYFGYYNRIREKLEQAWNSRLREAFQQSSWMTKRALASNQSYYTRIVVELDRHGRITAIQMLEQSGAKDLDKAAVDAFNQAGPFPDPPSGLVEKDGKIRVPWGFHVST